MDEKLKEECFLNRYISVLYRMSNPYFDRQLHEFQMGCGQQGFLLHISKHPGISFQELAANGHYDKATATRAVRKLEELGYVRLEKDQKDHRIRHIYLTEQANPVMDAAESCLEEWQTVITKGFTKEEQQTAEELLERMAGNAHHHMLKLR